MTAPQRALAAVLAVMSLFGMFRQSSLNELRQRVREEEAASVAFSPPWPAPPRTISPFLPIPSPTRCNGFLLNVFKGGLDRHILTNSPTLGGAGAEVKMRNLKPEEVRFLLTKMTKVNLIFRRLVLADVGSRSMWMCT